MKKTICLLLLAAALMLSAGCSAAAVPPPPDVTAATPTPAEPSSPPAPTPAPTETPRPQYAPYAEEEMAETPEGLRYIPATPTPTPRPTPVPLNPKGQEIADLARGFEGCPYKYGGKDPETGFDCSGLVWYVYGEMGIELPRTSDAQAKAGELVPPDEIMPGDILCFWQGGWFSHVGIYLGDDWYIHAEGTGIGVKIAALSDRTGRIETRRVFE